MCVPASRIHSIDEAAMGGKVILPVSALNEMMGSYSYGGGYGLGDSWGGSGGPMVS